MFICYVVAKTFLVQWMARNNTTFVLCNQHKHSLTQNPISTGHWVEAITSKRTVGPSNPGTSCGWSLCKTLSKYLGITIPILCIRKDPGQLVVSIAKKHYITECYVFYTIRAIWTLKRKSACLCSKPVIAGSSFSIPLNCWRSAHLCCFYSIVVCVIQFTV